LREKQLEHRFFSQKRHVFFRLFRSSLQFDFGHRDVLSLVVSVSTLQPFERFGYYHLLRACREVVPNLDLVPHSEFSFCHPVDKTISCYIEIERREGQNIPFSDVELLKKQLQAKLEAAIERVDHHLDLPQNDEDTIRNSVLLSQQIQEVDDPPQMTVHFQGQTVDELVFHVTYIRIVDHANRDTPPLFVEQTGFVKFNLLSCFVFGTIDDHVKQVSVYKVLCTKEPFFRLDHSIDFLKSREFVTHCVDEALGKARDLNGGLICQQYDLLKKVKKRLSQEGYNNEFLLEEFFNSLRPASMKSLLEPEHVITAFSMYLSLRERATLGILDVCLRQETNKELYIGFVYPENLPTEELLRTARNAGLKEHEFAFSQIQFDGKNICSLLLLTHEKEVRVRLSTSIAKSIEETKKRLASRMILRLSLSRSTHLLSSLIGTDFVSGIITKMLYEGLMRLDPSGHPALAAAERVDISQDGLRYTFALRDSVWSNGRPVTAYDFEYAWRKVLSPNLNNFFDYLFYAIKNARLVKEGKLPIDALGIHVVNDRILIVDLEHPAPHFLELCCLWIYSPLFRELDRGCSGRAYIEEKYVSNGPFKVLSYNPESQLQLIRSDQYWDKDQVYLNEITFSIIDGVENSLELFSKGGLDWVGDPLNEIHLGLFKQSDLKVYSQPIAAVLWFALNVDYPIFRSIKIRHAFSLSLDRANAIKKCLYGDERPSHSILPPSLSLLQPQDSLPFDLERSRQLFSEGLHDLGIERNDLQPLSILVQDRDNHLAIAKEAVRMWKTAFAINVKLHTVKRGEFLSKMDAGEHAIAVTPWGSWYDDPQYTLDIFKGGALRINPSTWANVELAELVRQGENEVDIQRRRDFLKQAELLVMNEMPIIPIHDYSYRYIKNENLDGVVISKFGIPDFRWAKIKRTKVHG
jgi:oligopeptide transport system substrate-binding protein